MTYMPSAVKVDWSDVGNSAGLDIAGGRSFFPHARYDMGHTEGWQLAQAVKHGHTNVVVLADGEGYVVDRGGESYVYNKERYHYDETS